MLHTCFMSCVCMHNNDYAQDLQNVNACLTPRCYSSATPCRRHPSPTAPTRLRVDDHAGADSRPRPPPPRWLATAGRHGRRSCCGLTWPPGRAMPRSAPPGCARLPPPGRCTLPRHVHRHVHRHQETALPAPPPTGSPASVMSSVFGG